MRKIIVVLSVIGMGMLLVVLLSGFHSLLNPDVSPQLVEDTLKIRELEEANDNYLKDLKVQLLEAIGEPEAEKVVFYVNYLNSVDGYLVTLYFKRDGQWYCSYIEQFDSRLSNKLREELGDLIW